MSGLSLALYIVTIYISLLWEWSLIVIILLLLISNKKIQKITDWLQIGVGVGYRIFKKLQKGYKKALATNSYEIKN